MMICRVCCVENEIARVKDKRKITMGICPACGEYHALFQVEENTNAQNVKLAQDLVALRKIDDVLARGGE